MAQTIVADSCNAASGVRPARQLDFARVFPAGAGDALDQFGLAVSLDTSNADDLAAAH